MKLACPYCQHENDIHAKNCSSCAKSLEFTESQVGIHNLKIQLLDIKQKFDTQYQNLFQRITVAEQQLVFLQRKQAFSQNPLEQVTVNQEVTPKFIVAETPKTVEEPSKVIENLVEENNQKEIERLLEQTKQREKEKAEEYKRKQEQYKQETNSHNHSHTHKEEPYQHEKYQKREKRQKTEPQSEWWADVENFLTTTLVGTFFAPLAQFWGYLVDLYTHYKSQDKLPAFFMTVGGIIALLFGFGYLLQFVEDSIFEYIKIAASTAAGIGLVATGAYLHSKEQKYHDFGSALQGLGVTINFLVIYFLSYSEFITFSSTSPIFSVIFIIANTILAFFLAAKYETRVVLIVTLFGGAFAPFYLNSNVVSIYYFGYLWLLCAMTVLIAFQIKWKTAGTLAFLVSAAVIEIVIMGSYRQFLPIGSLTIILMLFAYLFFFFALYETKDTGSGGFSGFKIKETLTTPDIFNLSGNAALLVANLYNIYEGTLGLQRNLGYIYFVNAAIFLVVFLVLRTKLTKKMQVLLMIIVGSFAGFAVPQLFNQNISGLFWSLEGLALILCGFIFTLVDVRKEGYFVLILGLAKIVFSLPDIFTNWQLVLWTDGYINLLYGGIVLILTKILIDKYKDEATNYEKSVAYLSLETLSFWAVAVVWIPLNFYFPIWSYNFMLIGVFVLIAWSHYHKLRTTQWLGVALLGFLVVAYMLSVNQVGNSVFRFQTLPARIAMVELFLSLWVLQFFYEKLSPESAFNPKDKAASVATLGGVLFLFREVFYLCLPLLILPSVFRFYPDYIPLALCGSLLIAFVVAEITKKIAVKLEFHLLIPIATFGLFTNIDNLNITLSASLLGLATLFGILIYSKGYVQEDKNAKSQTPFEQFLSYKLSNALAFYYLAVVIFLAASRILNNNPGNGILVAVLYFGVIVYFRNYLVPLQSNHKIAYRLGTLLGMLAIWGSFLNVNRNLASDNLKMAVFVIVLLLVVYHLLLYRKEKSYPMNPSSVIWTLDLVGIHIANALTYTIIITLITQNDSSVWLTIAFTLHALILLFHSTVQAYNFSLKIALGLFTIALYKLYAIDMANAETPQKVIVFMVIGVLMLGSSFLFMKFKEKK